ncbi:hypothetical protein C8R46DRAFT_1045443 [Mycena filopes]|nr:hypothetical protein C8R46DRAFT_1045443 [Mycena filopes]
MDPNTQQFSPCLPDRSELQWRYQYVQCSHHVPSKSDAATHSAHTTIPSVGAPIWPNWDDFGSSAGGSFFDDYEYDSTLVLSTNADSTAINQLECGAVLRALRKFHIYVLLAENSDVIAPRRPPASMRGHLVTGHPAVHGRTQRRHQVSMVARLKMVEYFLIVSPASVSVEIELWESTHWTEPPPPSVSVEIEPWESTDWAKQPRDGSCPGALGRFVVSVLLIFCPTANNPTLSEYKFLRTVSTSRLSPTVEWGRKMEHPERVQQCALGVRSVQLLHPKPPLAVRAAEKLSDPIKT